MPDAIVPSLMRRIALFLLIFAVLLAAHWPLLRLPYYWDEAGYYVPAAYDIFTQGDLIPHSTLTNAHPPLVMLYLALAWKLFGYSPIVTHTAILLIAALALLGVFELAHYVANPAVAAASTLCVGLYPIFFAQSSLAQVELAVAAFTLWGIYFYLKQQRWLCVAAFTLAALSKETAIIVPAALWLWEVIRKPKDAPAASFFPRLIRSAWLLLPALPLVAWFAYHYAHTGYVLGNPEFFRYNVGSTLRPQRIVLAAFVRLWQLLGHANLYLLTLAMGLAMFLAPKDDGHEPRERIAIPHQLVFAVVMAAYVVVLSLIGGALLARYMLPAIPFVIIISVSTIWRRVPGWPVVLGLVCAAFVAGLLMNSPFVFAPEDSLAYSDFVVLHQQAAGIVEERFPQAQVLTAWPATDELLKPYLGYVTRPHKVLQLETFSREEFEAAGQNAEFDIAIVFSRTYEPPRRLPLPEFWKRAQARFFDYHPNVPPELAAQILGGNVVWKAHRGGQWIAIITIPQIRNAGLSPPGCGSFTSLVPSSPHPEKSSGTSFRSACR